MSNKKLATFRIDEEKWLAFQDKAKADGSNASSVLLQFVSGYLDGSIDINLDNPVKSISLERRIEEYLANNLEKYLEKHLDIKLDAQVSNAVSTAVLKAQDLQQEQLNQTIEANLEPLTGRLEAFDSRLGKLSCRLDLLEEQTIRSGTTPPENELQGMEAPTDDQLTQGVSKAASELIKEEAEKEREAEGTDEQEEDQESAVATEPEPRDYAKLPVKELRKLCVEHDIQYAHAHGKGKHLKKAEMIETLQQTLGTAERRPGI